MAQHKKTRYPGVSYRVAINKQTQKEEKTYYVRYRDPEGKEHFEKVGSSTHGMNPSAANQIRSRKAEGKEQPNRTRREEQRALLEADQNRWTFNRLWQHYLENRENYKGEARDSSVYENHIQPAFGDREPHDLIALDIDRLKKKLYKDEGLKDQTVKNILELIRRLANWGKKRQLTTGLGFNIEMPKPNNEVEENLPPHLIVQLITTLDQTDDRLEASFIMMCLFTGRRTGEICRLTWDDLDLDNQTMTLKGTKSNRDEVLPIADALVDMLEHQAPFHKKWVFPNRVGGERKRLDTPGRNLIRSAGIPKDYRPTYCLRHTFASTAADIDIPWHVIKELLGHKSGKRDITARYAHVSHKVLLEAVNRVVGEMLRFAVEEAKESLI